MHECWDNIVVRSAMGIGLRLLAWYMRNEWYTYLINAEIAAVSPVVIVVFVELLPVVACDNNERVVIDSILLESVDDIANERIGGMTEIAIQVPEWFYRCIVIQCGIVRIRPCGLEVLRFVFRPS